jgi:hypothetical protein
MSRAGLREELAAILPERLKRQPVDARGYNVPWFVEWIDGKPDFRVMDQRKRMLALRDRLCGLCGERVGGSMSLTPLVFCIGPMCVLNSITSEPGMHTECAHYAVHACPFLTLPQSKYRSSNLPAGSRETAGMLTHNPGACALYATRKYSLIPAGTDTLVRLGEPVWIEWYAEGQPATREAVVRAMQRGLPMLHQMAMAEGAFAEQRLSDMINRRAHLLPRE